MDNEDILIYNEINRGLQRSLNKSFLCPREGEKHE